MNYNPKVKALVWEKIVARREAIENVMALTPILSFDHEDNAKKEMEFNAYFVYALKKLDEIVANEEKAYDKKAEQEPC